MAPSDLPPSTTMAKNKNKGNSPQPPSVVAPSPADPDAMTNLVSQLMATIAELNLQIAEMRAERAPKTNAQSVPGLSPPPPSASTGKTEKGKAKDATETAEVWNDVKPRKAKAPKAATSDARAPDSKVDKAPGVPQIWLREEDWNIPVVMTDKLIDGASGVAIVSQAQADKLVMELDRATGKMAIITRWNVPAAGDKCCALMVKGLNMNNRLEIREMHITQLGDTTVAPKYVKESTMTKTSITLENRTRKVVLTMDERYVPTEVFKAAKLSQRVALEGWLKAHELGKELIYMGRPSVKQVEGRQYIEVVASFHTQKLQTLLQGSGDGGTFAKLFVDKDDVEKRELYIVWFEEGTTLADALSRAKRHPEATMGLVAGKGGLGVRFKDENFASNVKKVFGAAVAQREELRRNSKVYEISAVPPWVQFDQLAAGLLATLQWEVSYVTTFSRGNTKNILVRAGTPPSKDVVIYNKHWMPIQEARERTKPTVSKLRAPRATPPAVVRPTPPKAVDRVITRTEASSSSDSGNIMGMLQKLLAGQAETTGRLLALESRMEIDDLTPSDFEDELEEEDDMATHERGDERIGDGRGDRSVRPRKQRE